jgi:hypothetical protein
MNLPSLLSLAVIAASVSIPCAAADLPARRSTSSVASQPPPAAAGSLRILLVDDDFSDNNHNPRDSRLTPSDRVFRKLVADAVGGDAKAWAIEAVKPYASGPGIERLRPFSVIVWYTGAIYGGNPDNTGVLSVEDEKTVRRYLEEVGGAVILISPGYLSKVLGASGTWEKTDWPFLSEVLGLRGGTGLAQRFQPGTVTATTGGRQFSVGKGGPVETQFSLLNPAGASVLFTTVLSTAKPGSQPAPVATAHSYGRGRFVYVGFTFENLAEADLAPAFQTLLAAAGTQPSPAMTARGPQLRQSGAPDPGPLTVQVSGTPARTVVSWTLPSASGANASLSSPAPVARKPSAAPTAGRTVKVEREERWGNSNYWQTMVVQPGASQAVDDAPSPGYERRYRVTVTDASGATGSKEVRYTAPVAQDPASITATEQSDGSIIVTWPEVAGVTKYRVHGIAPVVVDGATEWRSPPLDGSKRRWMVTSLYERDGQYVSLTEQDSWPHAITEGEDQYYLTSGRFTLHTGNDNKEILSGFEIKLYINGGETKPEDSANPNPLRLQDIGYSFGSKDTELKVNSSADLTLRTGVDVVWSPQKNNLANIRRHGLRMVIKYFPNFPLDAWKIDRVTMTINFQNRDQIRHYAFNLHNYYSPGMQNKTITFSNVGKLLTERDNQLHLLTDGALQPIGSP